MRVQSLAGEQRDDVTNVDIMREVTILREIVSILVAERDREDPSTSGPSNLSPPSYCSY